MAEKLRMDMARILIEGQLKDWNIGKLLGKKEYPWSCPAELQEISKRLNRTMIGKSAWNGYPQMKFICICRPEDNHPFYMDLKALKTVIK